MPTVEKTNETLYGLFKAYIHFETEYTSRMGGPNRFAPSDNLADIYYDGIKRIKYNIDKCLVDLLRCPPHLDAYTQDLKRFHEEEDKPYEKSVFIMSKFPRDKGSEDDIKLNKVMEVVSNAIHDLGYFPRIARGAEFDALLWKNVELHLLGCAGGVAIVEDRYKKEFNPNVAMEWGWMRAMGKPVLYLIEEQFGAMRADIEGFVRHPFKWDEPEEGIPGAVQKWIETSLRTGSGHRSGSIIG
jgi:hypothetical protein